MDCARQDNFKKQFAFNYALEAPPNSSIAYWHTSVHRDINIHKAEVGEKKRKIDVVSTQCLIMALMYMENLSSLLLIVS